MMNLIIIGNGFDMAHGLKTSYSSFIEYLVNNKYRDRNLFSDLFEFTPHTTLSYKSYSDIKKNYGRSHLSLFTDTNPFFNRLTRSFFDLNWCDIEKQYFHELSNIGENGAYESALLLNKDFGVLKTHLLEYLKEEQKNFEPIDQLKHYFSKFQNERTMVLNFNYTNTVSKYFKDSNKNDLVQIHGEIDNPENPIIFGYAADNDEARKLITLDDKEFMRNIKKHNYKRTEGEDKLLKFLSDNKKIEVSIIGHSCGISDKLILKDIMNHQHVSNIRLFHHKTYEHYFETQVNIDRIMYNDESFKKLINFKGSVIIPQANNIQSQEKFIEKIQLLENEKLGLSDKQYPY